MKHIKLTMIALLCSIAIAGCEQKPHSTKHVKITTYVQHRDPDDGNTVDTYWYLYSQQVNGTTYTSYASSPTRVLNPSSLSFSAPSTSLPPSVQAGVGKSEQVAEEEAEVENESENSEQSESNESSSESSSSEGSGDSGGGGDGGGGD